MKCRRGRRVEGDLFIRSIVQGQRRGKVGRSASAFRQALAGAVLSEREAAEWSTASRPSR